MRALNIIFFPWLTLLAAKRPHAAAVCMAMQISIVGWPIATMWAHKIARR